MGYYVRTIEGQVTVPQANLDLAYKALCDLNKRDDLKTGGSWAGGKQVEKWFSWMKPNYPEVCQNTKEIMEMVGFECTYDENGNLLLFGYDNKTGCEMHFMAVLSEFCSPHSFFRWQGEEGEMWEEKYGDKTVTTRRAQVVWS